jgi:hypothetical protein
MYRPRFEPNTSPIQVWSNTCLLSTDFIGMVVMMMMMIIFVRAKERISPSRFVAQTVIADGKVVRFRNGSLMNRYLCCIRAWVGVQLHFCSHSFGP